VNNIKSSFSIKDLENLSGIKAHTIRIWEKRYNLLEPERTDTNIRYYSLSNLQKLLNISFLNSNGYKISKIATIPHDKIPVIVREIAANDNAKSHAINTFKLAMLNFDQGLFYSTYESLIKEKTFQEIFYEVFVPIMTEIGMLWQTDTITPAHEHFLTTFIRQKILVNTELLQSKIKQHNNRTFVLYLPDNEIHELGLMFINYEIINKGYHSIFLGSSVPISSLIDILSYYDDVTFISYFTVKPEKDVINSYIDNFYDRILKGNNHQFWILGQMLQHIDKKTLPKSIKPYKTIDSLVKEI
jgi:methanogenic corrinoid protein MtbC1